MVTVLRLAAHFLRHLTALYRSQPDRLFKALQNALFFDGLSDGSAFLVSSSRLFLPSAFF